MGDVIRLMTSEQIQHRLGELDELLAALKARDLDAELAEVLRCGGDVDALEAAHLDVERQARRARVERQALEAELPAATKREGAAALAVLQQRHTEMTVLAPAAAEAVTTAFTAFATAVEGWLTLQREAERLTEQAHSVSAATRVGMPPLGTFQSRSVISIGRPYRELERKVDAALGSAEHRMSIGGRLFGIQIDDPIQAQGPLAG